jgi:hypothetical protein
LVEGFTLKASDLESEVSRLKDENEYMEECFQEAVEQLLTNIFRKL